MSLFSNSVTVEYKDRVWEIDLSPGEHVDRGASSIALDLQAALNLSRPPVGLCLRASPGEDAVVFPLSVLIACPSYITTAFRGRSWVPLLEGGEEDEPWAPPPSEPAFLSPVDVASTGEFPPRGSSPLKIGVPDQDLSMLVGCGSNASPSEGWGRPLTAPPGDRTRGVQRPRPGRREGLGRPLSATPSDKWFGSHCVRPGVNDGFARPAWAPSPSRGNSAGSSFARGPSSPNGFRFNDWRGQRREFGGPQSAPSQSRPAGGRSSSRQEKISSNLSLNSSMLSKLLAERRNHTASVDGGHRTTRQDDRETPRIVTGRGRQDRSLETGSRVGNTSNHFWV